MDDAVARYRAASEANDIDALMNTLAADVELVSPLAGGAVFKGAQDMRILLGAVYSALRDFHWDEEIGTGELRVLIGAGRVGGCRIGDAMALELDADGLIRRIRPHLRPWLGLTAFAVVVGPRLAAHPGVLIRATRG